MVLRTQFLHFDSKNATYVSDPTNTTGVTLSPYNAIFKVPYTLENVKKIYLTSLELPIGFTNCRTGSTDTLSFTISMDGTQVGTVNCVLPEKTYTSITTLCSDLSTYGTAAIQTALGSSFFFTNSVILNLTVGVMSAGSATPYRIYGGITGTFGSHTFSMSVIDTTLSKYILGWRAGGMLSGNSYSSNLPYGPANFNLNVDNYISMYIPSINAQNASCSQALSTFKIPLNVVSNLIYYYDENTSFKQWVEIRDSSFKLSNIQVVLYDRFGKNIQPNGIDYSFGLKVIYETP